MSKPAITVLMAVYNGERWLAESIESVLNQTFDDFEFLIVNDGSTDGSLEIIERYAKKDKRIRVINKPNSGLADSLNRGIAEAKGRWIARIDADDICEPERLEMQYNLALSDPTLVLIGTGLQEIDERGVPGKAYKYPRSHRKLVRRLTLASAFFAHSSALYKTDIVRSVVGYRPRILRSQDWDLWLRLSEMGRLACVDLPLVRLRHHDYQVSHDEGGKRQIVDSRTALVSYWLRRYGFEDPVDMKNSEEDFNAFRNWIAFRLQRDRYIEYRLFIKDIKTKVKASSNLTGKLNVLLAGFFNHPSFYFRYLIIWLFGERLAKRYAADWIKIRRSCAE